MRRSTASCLVIWYAAYRVGARLLREWDAGIDALLGGYSTAQLELQQLLSLQQDSESQVGPIKTWLPAIATTQRSCWHQVATIGLGNDQRFENYRSRFPRYTSIQGSVVQTLQVGGGLVTFASAFRERFIGKYRYFPPYSSSGDGKSVQCSAPRSVHCFLSST